MKESLKKKDSNSSSIEYITSVYGGAVGNVAKRFYDSGTVTMNDRFNRFSITISNEVALWVYISTYFDMRPVKYINVVN